MSLIKYEVSVDPSKPQVNLSISATPNSFSVTFEGLGDYSIDVKPSTGTIVGGVVSGAILGTLTAGPLGTLLGGGGGAAAVYAVGALLKSGIESGVSDAISSFKGKKETASQEKPLGYTINVEGVNVNVEAESVTLGTYDTMLLVTGAVKVS